MNLNLSSRLGRPIVFGVSYVKTNRVLDLANLGAYTIVDQSPEGNDATLYTGRFVSTDGSSDAAINADCSAAGTGYWRITGKVKPAAGVTTTRLQLRDSEHAYLTGLTPSIWNDISYSYGYPVIAQEFAVGKGGPYYANGSWSDIRLFKKDGASGTVENDVLVGHWQLNDSSAGNLGGYPALDSSGNGYHGSHVGCAGGTGEASILQTAGLDFNKRMWFDGVNDYVSVAGMTASVSYFGACTISATVYVSDTTTTEAICSLGGSAYRIFKQTGTWRLNGVQLTDIAVVAGINTISVDYDATGQAIEARINGSTWTGTSAVGTAPTTTFYIGTRNAGAGVGLLFKGLVYNFSLTGSAVKNFAFAGDELVTWTDTIGSNNGTVNGSPSPYLVPASDATPANDALGNAIANPRVNNSVLNLFGDGEYALVPDAASLDLTTAATWEMWGNFYGDTPSSSEALLSKTSFSDNQRTVDIARSVAGVNNTITFTASSSGTTGTVFSKDYLVADKTSQIVFTYAASTLLYYIDGVLTAPTASTGTVASSLHTNSNPYLIGARPVGGASSFAKDQIARTKIYDVALTADQVLQNYNAQKAAFGL